MHACKLGAASARPPRDRKAHCRRSRHFRNARNLLVALWRVIGQMNHEWGDVPVAKPARRGILLVVSSFCELLHELQPTQHGALLVFDDAGLQEAAKRVLGCAFY